MRRFEYVIGAMLTFWGCNTTEPPPPPTQPNLTLSAIDASSTEVWLQVTLRAGIQPRTITLQRDSIILLTTTLGGSDTMIVDEQLEPRRQYVYTLTRANGTFPDRASSSIITMDTTSHNWVFDPPVLLGDGSSSVLYDVTIINDSLAYAVGEIYRMDSLGNWDPNAYNMARWDGVSWQLMRIQFYTICGQTSRTPYPASSIFAFTATDVWITSRGGQMAHWDGTTQTATICTPDPFVINKIWGESPNSIWAVGYGGRIGHYTNGAWTNVESETGLEIYDVYASWNSTANKNDVYAVAAQQFVTFDKRIFRVVSNGVSVISDSGIPYSIHGIWFKNQGPFYVVGSGIYRKYSVSQQGLWEPLHSGLTPYYIYAVRGNNTNDIFACGSFGEFLHFNGKTWRSYRTTPGFASVEFNELRCRNDLVIAVGYDQPRATAVVGRRQ